MTTKEEFREFGRAMIDFVADYLENIRDRPVLPDVKPGYLKHLIPTEAPEDAEQWKDIMKGDGLFSWAPSTGLNYIFVLKLNQFTLIPGLTR